MKGGCMEIGEKKEENWNGKGKKGDLKFIEEINMNVGWREDNVKREERKIEIEIIRRDEIERCKNERKEEMELNGFKNGKKIWI